MFRVLLVIILTGLGVGAGWFGSERVLPAQWTVSLQFDAPKVTDLGNYYSLYSTYQLLKGDSYSVKEFDEQLLQNVYGEFKRNLSSVEQLQQFLLADNFVKQIATVEYQPVEIVAQKIAQQLKLDTQTQRVSVSLANPEQAKILLTNWLNRVSEKSKVALYDDLVAKWRVLFEQVKQSAEVNLGVIQHKGELVQQDWAGKLKVMNFAQPLDDKLKPFRIVPSTENPIKVISVQQQLWAVLGGILGLMLAVILILVIRPKS